ncbi:hypothetical protein ACH95_20745 [Bacillus glycinifermentans]|uniref:sunset domain-containing protein n=1 Tax=Bacillus glycinifermentans TaxID=1664069 RepID=UPI000652AE21|nr:hypothetical protein [Bacillus glycinifermentans]KMM53800.1 hypothetical protein ACH95_20745 [Bacillus glycinifermentans]MEC0493637.1 hypothetical protein [Bacillus glycinifermentans]MEC0541630.1 hypothetical protein [Bacillus glycinifermentans]
MEFFYAIGFLFFTFSLGYAVFHLIRKKFFSPDKRFSKKIFYPFLIGGFLLCAATSPYTDQKTYAGENETKEQTAQIKELTSEKTSLSNEIKSLKERIQETNETLASVKTENETLKKENENLLKEKDKLAKDKKSAEKKLAGVQKNSAKTKQAQADKQTEATSAGQNKSSGSSKKTAEHSQECNIKGSVNKIYHTPGSTYYDRTKNVVQWFCSEQEAQDAGYRPPKR